MLETYDAVAFSTPETELWAKVEDELLEATILVLVAVVVGALSVVMGAECV